MSSKILVFLFVCCGVASLQSQEQPKSSVTETFAVSPNAQIPPVQLFVPGFVVREVPVKLTNLVNIEYAPDGRMFAAGYDGRIHLLTDTDGDGLEDKVTTFWEQTSTDYPLGMVFHDQAVYVLLTAELVRFVDTNGDGIPDRRETVLKDWDDARLANHPLILRRRVDYGMGLAIGNDGSIYIGMGNAAYNNGYMIDREGKLGDDKNKSYYDRDNLRGCVIKFSPDGKSKEQFVTGVRYLMSLQFNRHGDLFATDQEGATWLPNGNPFDELLHLQPGRHYGFPPMHPSYLPDVIDEPSVFDYAPQHLSLCGFRFNEGGEGRAVFGPTNWQGDALISGFSRGRLYRTQLAKTAHGYVAQNHLLGSMQSMPSDLSIAPSGDMVVASHSGIPDWGTGPQGEGLLHKIQFRSPETPQPVATWSAGPGEFRIAFDRPLDATQLRSLTKNIRIDTGRNVFAGDRFETIRPGYEVVKQQSQSERRQISVLSAGLAANGRTLVIQTVADYVAQNFAITLPGIGRNDALTGETSQQPSIDLCADRCGVEVEWKSSMGPERWSGWLPHVDLAVSKQFTHASSEHEHVAELLQKPGTLRLRGQLNLWEMLQPAIQPISKLDYERPIENVTVVFRARKSFQIRSGAFDHASSVVDGAHYVALHAASHETQWLPFEIDMATDHQSLELQMSWFTDLDRRERAMALRRILLPWAKPHAAMAPIDRSKLPALVGGNWNEGRKLFTGNVVNCSKCHQIRGAGAKIGPDLSNLIYRDYDSVLRDMLEPNAAINPDYLNYIVLSTSGQVFSGVIVQESERSITLADSAGKLSDIARVDIEEIKPAKTSVMPQDLLKQINPDQLRDLMTFLLLEPATFPPGWSAESPREEIRPDFAFDPQGGPHNTGAFVISHDQREGLDGWMQKTFEVKGGEFVRFHAVRRATAVASPRRSALARVLWRNDAGAMVFADVPEQQVKELGHNPTAEPEHPVDGLTDANGWTTVSGTYRVPAKATRAIVELHLQWAPNGRVEWSDIEFSPSTPPTKRSVRLATVHHVPKGTTARESCEEFAPLIADAALQKADLVVLGETVPSASSQLRFQQIGEMAETIPGPSTNYFGQLAKQHGLHIVLSLYERSQHLVYNTAVLLGPDGHVIGKYRKVCLPHGEVEKGIAPGDSYPVFDTTIGKVGMMVCYDGFFPEVARELTKGGAEIIAWPVWGCNPLLAKARACENHVYVVSSTFMQPNQGWMLSAIFDQTGKPIAQAESWGTVVVAEVELSQSYIGPYNLGDFRSMIERHRPMTPGEFRSRDRSD